jgi:hypothetical protein
MIMKYLFYSVFLILFLGACNNNPTGNNAGQVDTTRIDTAVKRDTIAARLWIIKDSSLYSKKFLTELYEFKDGTNNVVSLVDNCIICGKDTSYFPDYFSSLKQCTFEAKNDSEYYKLLVFNATYTTLQFDFSLRRNGKLVQHHSGEAEIPSGFFLASGGETDDEDSTMYGVYEYSGENSKYSYEISVGTKGDELLATFSSMAKDSLHEQSFRNCPTLRSTVKYTPAHKIQ